MKKTLGHGQFTLSGTKSWPEFGLSAAWTAQPDSFAALQVFRNETGDIELLFSGECFAGSDMRAELVRNGHDVGSGAGDWLVHQYEELGESFFRTLNGLFCGLLVDRRQGRVFLFNDRYGIERLYWYQRRAETYFATEAKALLAVLPELREFDEEGVAQFLRYGCTLDNRTMFRGLSLAPGGTLWTVANGECEKSRHFSPAEWEDLPVLGEKDYQERFTETFQRVLPNYFSSSDRIGISLTGGLDTRMIMACLPPQKVAPVSYTFAGRNRRMLDARVAAKVAESCGLQHDLICIDDDFFGRFGELADQTVFASDGCFGVLGAHEIYLNGKARQWSSIRVTGNFGSEILRSVSTFKPLGLAAQLFDSEFSRSSLGCGPAKLNGTHPVTFAAFKEIPWNLFGSMCAGRSQVTFRTPYLDNELVALAYQAPPSSRTSGVSAVRFVKEVNPALAAIPTDRGDGGNNSPILRVLRRLYAEVTFKLDYYCSEGLPFGLAPMDGLYQWCNAGMGIQGLHKFLVYRNWLKRELAPILRERMHEAKSAGLPHVDSYVLDQLVTDHLSGRRNYTREIHAVLTLEAVGRLLLARS